MSIQSIQSPTFHLRLQQEVSWLQLVCFNSSSCSAENIEALHELATISPINPITPNLEKLIEKVKKMAEQSIIDPTIAKDSVELLRTVLPPQQINTSPAPRAFTPVYSPPPPPVLRRTISPFIPIQEMKAALFISPFETKE